MDIDQLEKVAPAAVLSKPLGESLYGGAEHGTEASAAEWLQAWYAVKNQSTEDLGIHEQMLARITDRHRQLVVRDASGAALATALGVISKGLLGIHGVATATGMRRQGLAAALLSVRTGEITLDCCAQGAAGGFSPAR